MYNHIVFDISGWCNAFCRWCVTGNCNRKYIKNKNEYTSAVEFKEIYVQLKNKKLIEERALFFLYNWGEPFLNPEIKEIMSFLTENNHEYVLSTNGSIPLEFNEENELKNLRAIVFSIPGFNQQSFDKIHGFNVEKIKQNIVKMLRNYREHGFNGKVELRYHVYQFSLDQVMDAIQFAKDNHMGFSPTYAGIADLKRLIEYLDGTMPYEELKELSSQLVFHYPEEVSKSMPKDYKCPYHEALFLDHKGNILTCCMVTDEMEGYSIGTIFDIDTGNLKKLKRSQEICKKCMDLKIPYLINNRPYPIFIDDFDLNLNYYNKNRELIIYGAGEMAKVLAVKLDKNGIKINAFIQHNFEGHIIDEKKVDLDYLLKEDKPYVIVANEYIDNSVKELEKRGYQLNLDYYISNIVRRDY